LALLLFLVISGTKPQKFIRLAGSTAFQPFAEKLAEIYMEKHPGIIVDVQGGGSAVGIMAANQGIVDIGMVDMVSLPKVAQALEAITVARDGIAVIVHSSNKIKGVTSEQLKNIFSGEISNWKDVGEESAPIRVISREEGSGTRKSFDQLVLLGKRLTPEAMFQDSNGTIREAVRRDPQAIGYISIGFLSADVKPLPIDGIPADNENVKAEKYKIARPIYFLLKSNPSADARDFVNFILSNDAQQILANDGLIPVR
jgi:phosphate transport system substrate-binding protein